MIEYLVALGLGAGVAVVQEIYESRKYKRFLEVCEENKKAFDRLNTTLDNPEKMSRLVSCLTDRNK